MDCRSGQFRAKTQERGHIHIMIVSSDGKGKATWDAVTRRVGIGAFQGTTGEHCFLGIVEGNSAELLPVAHELVLDDDLMDSKFALVR